MPKAIALPILLSSAADMAMFRVIYRGIFSFGPVFGTVRFGS
jgi:hypothetical protein